MTTFTITRKLDLPSEKVWTIVSDFTSAPGHAIKIEVEEKGNSENGIGAIRFINIKGAKARERLESVDAPNSITYRMLSGAPVEEYLGTVNVVPRDGATLVNWDVKMIPKIPGSGWLIADVIKKAIN